MTKTTTPQAKQGVIATIIESLTKATKTKPVTKDQILAKLVKQFPDRSPDAMKTTINCQVPRRLQNDKELKVLQNDNGYWIAK